MKQLNQFMRQVRIGQQQGVLGLDAHDEQSYHLHPITVKNAYPQYYLRGKRAVKMLRTRGASWPDLRKGKHFIWVLLEDGTIQYGPPESQGTFVYKKNGKKWPKNPGPNVLNHDDLARGKPIRCGGEGHVQGESLVIDNKSGHYQPASVCLTTAIQAFARRGYHTKVGHSV